MMVSKTREQQKVFIQENTTPNENGCWEWNKHIKRDGYGEVKWKGKSYRTHRLSFILWCGDIPEGYVVRHKCDNPRCCNPEHLEVGTPKDNSQDCVSRGRSMRGERNPTSKLTEKDVRVIRDIYDNHIKGKRDTRSNKPYSIKMLSEMFNVSEQLIDRCCRRLTWKHIT
jgi:hypothetical protein